MGILNRTPDSFYDKGATFSLDALMSRADHLLSDGADILDVGGVKAGPGPEVTEAEELDRVVPAIEALHARIDVPLSVDTWRASVARAAYDAGAVVGNDISGFADPDYLPAAAAAGATVVATHIRIGPRVPDPEPVYDDVVAAVAGLSRRARHPGAWRRYRLRSDRARRRARPGQDGGAIPGVAARLGRARRPGVPAACCPPRTSPSSARPSTSTSTTDTTPRLPPPPSASRWVAASCAPTMWPGRGASATPWPPCSRRREPVALHRRIDSAWERSSPGRVPRAGRRCFARRPARARPAR